MNNVPKTSPDQSPVTGNYYTIPAGCSFASDLARGILDLSGSKEELANIRILLPSRRATQALTSAFIEVTDGEAVFLPKMSPIGDIDEVADDILEQAIRGEAELNTPPAISELERQLILARLIERLPLAGQAITPAQAISLAQSLASLMDQVYQFGGTAADLQDVIPDDLAHHWAEIMRFLTIIFTNWPEILKEQGKLDPALRRLQLIDMQLASWRDNPPETPVILAGSTGSLPKTAEMMRCVAALPKGMVVFPGLDGAPVNAEDKKNIHEDIGHPFHQLYKTLAGCELEIEDVSIWPVSLAACQDEKRIARTAFLMQVLKPAPQSRIWRKLSEHPHQISRQAVDGLRRIYAKDTHQEADIIAALMRQTLEIPGKTAMLVTPDRKLARQVRAALLKWGLNIEDSAGIDLLQTSVGQYLQLIAEWIGQNGTATALLALLKHRLASGGIRQDKFRNFVYKLEVRVLREYLEDSSIKGLQESLAKSADHAVLLEMYNQHVLTPLAPLIALFDDPNPDLAKLADAHGKAAEQLAKTDKDDQGAGIWDGPDGSMAAKLLGDLALFGENNSLKVGDYVSSFRALCSGQSVRSPWRSHVRLAILGAVEGRMQSADLVILGGVNEGIWPPRQQNDPWTNQAIRKSLNLPDRRWRTGLSAHDFFMMASAKDVIITRARRADDTPTTPSRWLERMQAVLSAAHLSDLVPVEVPAELAALVQTGRQVGSWDKPQPIEMPRPCPDIALRPRQFSATQFDVWITDPYQIYAKKILKLRPLNEIDKKPDAALWGTLIHQILAELVKNHPSGPLPGDVAKKLESRAREVFAPYMNHPPVKFFWMPRFLIIIKWFIEHEQERRGDLTNSYAEQQGKIIIEGPNGPVTITAKADRLDIHKDGRLSIIDYKSGRAPTKKKVEQGRSTQLLVEALLAANDGFEIKETIQLGEFRDLDYWRLPGTLRMPGEIKAVYPRDLDIDVLMNCIKKLITDFDNQAQPYLAEPDPNNRPDFSDYRHLARIREWRPQEVGDD